MTFHSNFFRPTFSFLTKYSSQQEKKGIAGDISTQDEVQIPPSPLQNAFC
jgi:hypothetical protein